jgi:LPS-assembly lipoprotein
MSSAEPLVRLRAALAVLALLVASCGFEPVYGEQHGAEVRSDMQTVRVGLIANRSGQQLRRYMMDRIHPGDELPTAIYSLEVSVIENRQNYGIQRDKTATYARLALTGYYTLREIKTQKTVLTGAVNAYSSYNIASDPFNTVVAENDARERAVRSLGDDLINRIAFYLRNPDAGKTS